MVYIPGFRRDAQCEKKKNKAGLLILAKLAISFRFYPKAVKFYTLG
jgi:hypothetical protein